MKNGFHTPNRTKVFFNYLTAQGIDFENDTWHNDSADSITFKDLKIMFPNTEEDLEYYNFTLFFEDNYGFGGETLLFDNVRDLADFLKTYNEKDLFSNIQLAPQEVQKAIAEWGQTEQSYKDAEKLKNRLETIGYTCNYGLDGIPSELQRIQE